MQSGKMNTLKRQTRILKTPCTAASFVKKRLQIEEDERSAGG
jgi:hypothetical protein